MPIDASPSPNIPKDPEMCRQLLGSMFQITSLIGRKYTNASDQMNDILTVILQYLGVEQGSIMTVEGKKLVIQAATRRELVGIKQPLDRTSVAGWVALEGSPLHIPDIAKDKRFPGRGGDAYKKNALLSTPITHDHKVIGVINVTDKSGGADLSKQDVTCLIDFSTLLIWLVLQRKMNDELKRQRNTLSKRNKELRRQEILRGELSRTLVHDLKGPLSEVVANLDILSYSVSDENREFLESAQIGCNRTVRMVSNLVTVDKIEDGKIKLIKEETDAVNLLRESISAIKGLAKIKNVILKLEEPEEELPPLLLDRTMILRVLQNLLTNGLGYSTSDTTITVTCRPIKGKKKLEFSVQDQGPGIPAEKQDLIFEKYARVSSTQDSLVGTGLGLYFCRLAVEAHRGAIGVESRIGHGSRFFFTLPYLSEENAGL